MAASHLGPSRKGSPCLRDIKSGEDGDSGGDPGTGDDPSYLDHSDGQGPQRQTVLFSETWCCGCTGTMRRSLLWKLPLGDFFCCGFGQECIVNSIPIAAVPSRGLNCYFQMPFRKKARITLENQHANEIPAFFYQIDYGLYEEPFPEDYCLFPRPVEETADHGAWQGLCDPGSGKRERPLCRNLYDAYHPGTLLVGRGRNQFL